MSYAKAAAGALLLLSVAACARDLPKTAATPAPSGISNAGAAGTTGGAAAAPAGAGTVGRSSY